jgi:hypothetical protein
MPGLLDSTSLLSPDEEAFSRQQGLMNAAGALMKGAEWSVIPKSPFASIGDALQQYNTGYNGAADQLLKRETLRSTIDQKRLAAIQMIGQYASLGIPIPPLLKQMAGGAGMVGNFGNIDASGGGAPAAPGSPSPQSAAPMAPSMPAPAGGGLPPGLLGGAGGVSAMGAPPSPSPVQVAGPGAPPAPPMNMPPQGAAPMAPPSPVVGGVPDVMSILRRMPPQNRYQLLQKGPVSDILKGVIENNLKQTDTAKNAALSGKANPLDYELALKNDAVTEAQKNAKASGYQSPFAYQTALEAAKPTELQKNATASGKASPFQYQADLSKSEAEAKNLTLGVDEKGAKAAGFLTPDGQPDVPRYKGWEKQVSEVAGAQGKHIAGYVGAQDANRQAIDAYNVMEDSLKAGGDNIRTGPYADAWLKFKEAAADAGFKPKGVPESEFVQKFNTYAASQATKALGSREAASIFMQNMKANPGLMNSYKGSLMLIDVLRQAKQRDLELGRMGTDTSNLPNWTKLEQEHLAKNPIISPLSGLPLGTNFKAPTGWQFSRKQMQYRDPQSGKLFDVTGAPVQ